MNVLQSFNDEKKPPPLFLKRERLSRRKTTIFLIGIILMTTLINDIISYFTLNCELNAEISRITDEDANQKNQDKLTHSLHKCNYQISRISQNFLAVKLFARALSSDFTSYPESDHEGKNSSKRKYNDAQIVQLSFNPVFKNDKASNQEYYNEGDRDIASTMRLLPDAPEPVIGPNFDFQVTRSADCVTYTFSWSYTFDIANNDRTDFCIQNSGSNSWNCLTNLANSLVSSRSYTYSVMRDTFGYVLGQDINYRWRAKSAAYSFSEYYLGTATNILKHAPRAVDALTITQEMTTLTVSWTALPSTWTSSTSPIGTGNDPVTYLIQKCLATSCTYENFGAGTATNSLIYPIPDTTNLNWNTTYRFRMATINTCGTTVSTVPNSYTMLSQLPKALAAPTLVTAYDNTLKMAWTTLTTAVDQGYRQITAYQLQYCLSTTCTSPALFAAPYTAVPETSNLFFEQVGRTSPIPWSFGQTFYFRVRARNPVGLGVSTAFLTVVMPRTPLVAPVLSLVSKSMTSLQVSWTAITAPADLGNNPLLFYQLEWSSSATFASILNVLTGNGHTTTSFSLLRSTYGYVAGTTYYFRVAVKNQAGLGPYSTTLSIFTPTVPIKMATPTAPTISPLSIVISWTRLVNEADTGFETITSYVLQRCTGSSTCTGFTTIATIAASESSNTEIYTTSTTPRGQTHRYQIFATNVVGNSPISNILTIVTDNVPQSMTSVSCTDVQPKSMALTWTEVATSLNGGDPITFYAVEFSVGGSAWAQLNSDFNNLYITYSHNSATNFPANTIYSYRVRPKNGVDYGASYSAVITCLTDNAPTGMTSLTQGAVNPMSIVINWSELTDTNLNGRDLPIYYQLEWWNAEIATPSWQILTSESNGKVFTFTHSRGTVFPSGSTQQYRMLPQNNIGFGSAYSVTLSVQADSVPTLANQPSIPVSDIYPQKVMATWIATPVANDGGDAIIFYLLEWDQGINSWTALNTYTVGMAIPLSLTQIPADILSSGATYKYRISAKNGVGYSLPSTETSIVADEVPVSCNAPAIAQADIQPEEIKISWTAIDTANEGRDPIIFYRLEWDQGTNTWTQLNTYALNMAVPLQFTHSPGAIFTSGATLKYRLTAKNGVGFGVISAETSVLSDSIPAKMAVPQASMVRFNKIDLYWTALTTDTQIGRDPILYYRIEFFDRPCYSSAVACSTDFVEPTDGSWTDMISVVTTIQLEFSHTTATKFAEGRNYNYRVRAKNGVGWGPYSDTINVLTPTKPTFMMNQPSATTINPNDITIAWVALDNSTQFDKQGFDIITYYTLEVDTGSGTFSVLNPAGALVTTLVHSQASPFTNNVVFKYRVAASNGMGMGPYSDVLEVTTDDFPDLVKNLNVVSVAPKQIKVNWDALSTEPETGRDAVSYYKLEYHDNQASTTVWTEITTSSQAAVLQFQHDLSIPFPANIDQSDYFVKYRVSARNGVGFGGTTELLVLTKTFPIKMDPVVISDPEPDEIKISWTQLSTSDYDTGRDPVIHYEAQWIKQSATNDDWTTLTSYPDLSSSIKLKENKFEDNTWYRVRIGAQNGVGIGIYSNEELVQTDDVPNRLGRMPAPTEDPNTNANTIQINWSHLTDPLDTGRDPITYYRIFWDQGTNNWAECFTSPSNTMVFTYVWDSSIKNGTTYQFKIRPKNNVGSQFDTPILSVIPSSPPNRMERPIVTLSNSDTMVKIAWTYPGDNGDSIKAYMVEIRGMDNEWYTMNSTCDGSLSSIISERQCFVHMASLREEPFSLVKGDRIVVRINAMNIKGYNSSASPVTDSLFTQLIEVEPNAPGKPSRGGNTAFNTLHTSWSGVTSLTAAAGGVTCSITSYEVQRNIGNSSEPVESDTWISLQGFTSNNTATSFQTSTDIVGGTTYKVRARALNKYGWGPWSPDFSIICARAPSAPTWISIDNSTTDFLIKWQEPFNQGLAITRYYIGVQRKGTNANLPASYIQTSDCPGDDYTINSTQQCLIAMSTLRSSTYLYILNDKIRVRIWAENLMGQGSATILQPTNPTNKGQVQTVPAAPTTLVTNNLLITSDLQIQLTWAQLPTVNSWGGIEIIRYEIFWNDPSTFPDWELLFTDVPAFQLSYLHSKTSPSDMSVTAREIIPGTLYKMRYRGVNIHGEGSFSPEVSIYASTVPDRLISPVTSLLNTTVTIEWSPTPNDHARPVTRYAIRFKSNTGAFLEDSGCSGINAVIVSSMKCSMPMSKFTSAPYNLNIDDLIEVTVEASNVMGWSGQSLPNTVGVTAKRNPQAAPTGLARGANTGKNTMHLTWIGLFSSDQTGGQDVDYRVYYDKASNQATWSVLQASTNNITSYQHTNTVLFKTGLLYSFRVQAWNDFGLGAQNSSIFRIWAAIAPSGLAAPTTSLSHNTYVEEDDFILIDWDPPTDNGGLPVTYSIDIFTKNSIWMAVDVNTECYENNVAITDYRMPHISAAEMITQCTILVTNLKAKYSFDVGDIISARITASHVVGSVTSSPGGTAVLPVVPCFRTTFPRVIGGSNSNSFIRAMDVDDNGHIVVGGHTQDSNLLEGRIQAQTLPMAIYIAKGNYYQWAKYFVSTDTISALNFQFVSQLAIRWDGERVALVLERDNYDISYVIVVLNRDGTFFGAYRESNTNARGKVSPNGIIFDSANMITVGLDFAPEGTSTRRQAVINRFSVQQNAAGVFNTQFYIVGGVNANNAISQVFALQRIRGETSQFYLSALITDASGIRRSIIGKSQFTNGALQRYFVYAPGTEYNSDLSIAVVKRMNIEENDILGQHIISACIMSQDNYRIHFGEFVLTGTSSLTQTVLTPNLLSTYNTYNCLGTFSRIKGTLFFLYNYRRDANPSNHRLILGRVTISTKMLDELLIDSHTGLNQYGGARIIHMSRFYYFGTANSIHNGNTLRSQPTFQAWINLFDPLEWSFCCNPTTQSFSIPTSNIELKQVPVVQMDWKTSGLSSSTGFANSVTRQMRATGAFAGVQNLNLGEPLANNTWCPIVTTGGGAPTLTAPAIPNQMFEYNPDATSAQTQSFQFDPITVSRFCPDTVIYNLTYLSNSNKALPSFITLRGENNSYVFDVSSARDVGTYQMMLMSVLGNNQSTSVQFTAQVASPCLNNPVAIPSYPIPVYDISEWSPKFIDLNWVVTNATPSCGSVFQTFEMLNSTTGGPIDPNIYSIVNQSNGIQRIKIWTQFIPYAKLWSDLLVNSYLQGDFVASLVFTVNITNDCEPTEITPQVMPNWIYYTGRDSIDLTFVWSETVGKCGPITYSIREYLISDVNSNNTLDSSIFTSPSVETTNNTMKIFTADESKVGTYHIRVFASLGVGGYKQSSTLFSVQVIRDPCAYFTFSVPFIDDLTLWINQTDQTVQIPYFRMSDPSWICNFTYVMTTGTNGAIDPIFIRNEIVPQGTNPTVTLQTTDKTKVELSPYTIRVRGWPTRQPSSVGQSLTFRVYISFFDKQDCSSGRYYNSVTETCDPCSSPCSQCIDTATKCTWCSNDAVYVEQTNSCIGRTDPCPVGVRDPYLPICRTCSEFCRTCTDFQSCTACIPGYSLANKKCYPPRDCPEGFTYNGVDCTQCSANCASCVSPSKCNYCMQGSYLNTLNNDCVTNCPVGYYGDQQSRVCMICAPACRTCVGNNFTCTSCRDTTVGAITTFKYLFNSMCVDRCPYLNYYQNHNNRSCDRCNAACKICVGAVDDCIVCNEGSVISGRSCLNSCPAKSYITVIGTCFPCDAACQICTGAMNSMCSECVEGQFLTQTTCEPKCNPPLFPDNPSKSCRSCPYYCNSCTQVADCQRCKIGYRQVPNNCEGEMFLRLNGQVQINVPMDPALATFNPRQITSEIWFKIDNPLSSVTEVILGTSPYKIRKKANVAQIQLNFDMVNYCDSLNLKEDQWYHFAFVINEETSSLNCYLNGGRLSTGITSVGLISADILLFREITFGGSIELKTSENRFTGYVKEFRWWKQARSAFQIQNFKDISFITPPQEMLAYWRLDEDRKIATVFRESVSALTFTPTAPLTLPMLVEMREIYLKICPEGFYGIFNETSNMAECMSCHESCKNCNGGTNTSCTECRNPFKLIEAEQKCIVVEGCPQGYYEDLKQDCQPCHEYCITCVNSPTQCPRCKAKYFKQFRGLGCVDSCPRGLYGNYLTQACAANPIVTSLLPDDGTIFTYGSFIDLYATFEVLNQEAKNTYSYGWIITQLNGNVDLAKDAAKPYYETDITRVHLDNNILEPNKYYNITFFVKGRDNFYNGMIGSMFNVIYIGIPPKNGNCFISPQQGIAGVTSFRISTNGWVDVDGIAEYAFFYSVDSGKTFTPIKTSNRRLPQTNVTFDPIFQTVSSRIRCSAKSVKGFVATADNQFILVKRSSANSKIELSRLDIQAVDDETDAVRMSSRIIGIAKDLGKLQEIDTNLFDAKINADQCTDAICSFQGRCSFDSFTKKYFCRCNPGFGGVNCSFRNLTELDFIKNLTLDLCKAYNPMSLSGRRTYDFQFLNAVSSNLNLMTEDIQNAVFDILAFQVNQMKTSTFNVGDNTDVIQNLNIISNLLEYQYYNSMTLNQTNAWTNKSNAFENQGKIYEDLNKTINLLKTVRQNTLQRLSFLQTEISVQTRMIAFRQVLQQKESILAMPATQNMKKKYQNYFKMSPSNFINSTVSLSEQYIAEAIEYAINPFQINNTDNVAGNILEVSLYNYNRTPDGGSIINEAIIKNLSVPIDFAFTISENQNLTDFVTTYNQLSNFKHREIKKKQEMITKSNLTCVYWDKVNGNWSSDGCDLKGIDKFHIECSCNHLSSFTILFTTPKLTIDAPLLENTTVSAPEETRRNVTLKDIVKWPLSAYFANMYKLWQHNRPTFIGFIVKPGFAVLILFWAMYFSSLIYYSGRDDLRRFKMTKQQNRDDLAELNDDHVQNVQAVIKALIVQDFINENGKFIQKESRRKNAPQEGRKAKIPPMIKIYEQLSKEEQKKFKKRARRKVFGIPAGLCARAQRVYDITMKHNTKNPNAKMSFFNEELKNNLWIGLIAKTSKIAPRHVRLLLMYFYSSLYISLLTIIFAFQLQEYISDQALFQVATLAVALIVIVWIITIPVALIFRMPLRLRMMVSGVRTKKLNKAFQMVDQHMGWRYAIGYFICLSMFFTMTVLVLVFNIFYPHDYVMGWFFNIILIYIFDLIVFTFLLAAIQMVLVILSAKARCFYHVWKAIEVFRYVKNLRG